jgi:toxin-antitoxin system PIN domain toxin
MEYPPKPIHRAWLEALINAPAAYGISPQVLASVIRISTHARIYVRPSTLDEAIEFCRILLTQDTCTVIHPGDRHWEIFLDLCDKSGATGNLIKDAWFAALAIESGCEWVTTDHDYSRFPGLRWRAPL